MLLSRNFVPKSMQRPWEREARARLVVKRFRSLNLIRNQQRGGSIVGEPEIVQTGDRQKRSEEKHLRVLNIQIRKWQIGQRSVGTEIVSWDKLQLHYRSTDIWIATRWTFYHRFQAFQVYVLVKFTAWRMPKLFMWPGARRRFFKVFVIIDVNNACNGSQHLQLKKYFTPEIYVARAAITIATIATKLAANLDPNTTNS